MRHDFYGTVHKAIRKALFDLLSDVGTTDGDPQRWAGIEARFATIASILREHARHEEELIHPLLARHAAPLAERLAREHDALDGRLVDVQTALVAFRDLPVDDRREALLHTYRGLTGFVTAYSIHMELEESEAMPALWRAMDDGALRDAHGALLASLSPDTVRLFLSAMLPAINHHERVEVLAGLRAAAPPQMFDGVLALASSVLPRTDFHATRSALAEEGER